MKHLKSDLARGMRAALLTGVALVATTTISRPATAQPPLLFVSGTNVVEGDSGNQLAYFFVSLSKPATSPVSFSIETKGRSATNGVDFLGATPGDKFTIPAGQLFVRFQFAIKSDKTVEPNEKFELLVSKISGATLRHPSNGGGSCIIIDDDAKPNSGDLPALSVSNMGIAEGDKGTRPIDFAVSLSKPATRPVTVSFATRTSAPHSDWATDGVDYVGRKGKLTFQPGQQSQIVSVDVKSDTVFERNEKFEMVLSNPSGATLRKPTGLGTIMNDSDVKSGTPSATQGNRFSISGVVTEGNNPLRNLKLKLRVGEKVIATTTTNSKGAYSFTGLPKGNYMVVADSKVVNILPKSVSLTRNTPNVNLTVRFRVPDTMGT